MISALAAAGVFVAVPIVGRLVLPLRGQSVPIIARLSLWVSAGLAVWSAPLLGSLILGIYRPEFIGAAGWGAVAILVATRRVSIPRIPRIDNADRIVLVALLMAAALAAAFPADPFATGRDMGVYASHAVYMAHHGRLDVPYPVGVGTALPPGFLTYPGTYATEPTLTVQFGHLFPAWLAQLFAVAGYDGLVRLNVALGLFALLAVYGLLKRFVNWPVATLLMIFLAFNPAQIWITRQTLAEVLAQLLIWSGLLLLTAYLSRGRPRWGVWAGILLGLSAFARIDSFLLVPFLFIGHALWVVLSPRRTTRSSAEWAYIYLGAAPLFVAALAYYGFFSRPYLVQEGTSILQIGALTVVGATILGLTLFAPAMQLARAIFSRRTFLVGVFVVLAGLTAYAYFVRPALQPFDVYDVPGAALDGSRTHVEDALPNLGRYLTPAVVWGAVIGWSLVFAAATKRRRITAVAPLLIVSLGFSATYIWMQSIAPDHFWAIRRFVPVIIPAMVLFAGVAATAAISSLSIPGRRLALALSAAFALIFTLYIGAPTYAVRDRDGSYAALAEFAASVPRGRDIIALDGYYQVANFWMPLYLAFDLPVIPLDISTEAGRTEGLSRIRAASSENPVTIVTAGSPYWMDSVIGPRSVETILARELIVTYIIPVPRTTHVEDVTLTTIEATGLTTVGTRFGGPPQWLAPAGGFYPTLLMGDRRVRWTNGDGHISIPIEGDRVPTRLSISIADTGPSGADLRLTLNGKTLFDGAVPPGSWSAEYELAGVVDLPIGATADIEIVSSTSLPPIGLNPPYEGHVGVLVDSITLMDTGE